MRIIFFLLLLLFQLEVYAQIRTTKAPYVTSFKEVQVARLPEPEKNRDGFVYFIAKMSYFADSLPALIENAVSRTKRYYALQQFEKSPFRYYNYRHVVGKTKFYETAKPSNSFSDTTHFYILADRHQSYWSWKSLRRKERFIAVDTVYTGVFASDHHFEPARGLTQELKSKNASIIIYRNGEQAFSGTIEPKFIYKPFTFAEPLFQELGVQHFVDYSKSTVEIGKNSETLIIYFPLFRRRR